MKLPGSTLYEQCKEASKLFHKDYEKFFSLETAFHPQYSPPYCSIVHRSYGIFIESEYLDFKIRIDMDDKDPIDPDRRALNLLAGLTFREALLNEQERLQKLINDCKNKNNHFLGKVGNCNCYPKMRLSVFGG